MAKLLYLINAVNKIKLLEQVDHLLQELHFHLKVLMVMDLICLTPQE